MGKLPSSPTKRARPTTSSCRAPAAAAASAPSIRGTSPSSNPTSHPPSKASPTKRSRSVLPRRHASPTTRANTTSVPFDTSEIRNDRLGTLVRDLVKQYKQASSWEDFVKQFRGPSYLSEALDSLDHPAAELLKLWKDQGVPVHSTSKPWTLEQKDACVERGCHPSATQHAAFLREEMADNIENKFWIVLPYELVKALIELMLTPAAVKGERDRRPRLLCDHTWFWGWPSINETTIPHAPPEAMQFGWALPRLLFLVRHANSKYGPTRAPANTMSRTASTACSWLCETAFDWHYCSPATKTSLNSLAYLWPAPWVGSNRLPPSAPCRRPSATGPTRSPKSKARPLSLTASTPE